MLKYGVKRGDWITATKHGLAVFLRPGWPLKFRVSIALILHASGYQNEVAIMQVSKDAEGDAPKFVGLKPAALLSLLYRFAIKSFRESGVELSDEERKRLRVSFANLRPVLEELEHEDGTITRVRVNCEVKKLLGLSFEEALNKGLVVRIRDLSNEQRKRLSSKVLIYVHLNPRPATRAALMRRADEAHTREDAGSTAAEKGGVVQLVFAFMRRQGLVGDEKYAAMLAQIPEVRSAIDTYEDAVAKAKEQLKQADSFLKDVVARAAQRTPQEGVTPEPPVSSDPNQHQLFTPGPAVKKGDAAESGHAAKTGDAAGGLVSQPKPHVISAEEAQPIFEAMAAYCGKDDADWKTVNRLIAECRDEVSDCTVKEIVHFVHLTGRKMAKTRGIESPARYLKKGVVTSFEGPPFHAWRKEQAEFDAAEAKRQAEAEERERRRPEIEAQERLVKERRWAELREHPERCVCKGTGKQLDRNGATTGQPCMWCPAGEKRRSA